MRTPGKVVIVSQHYPPDPSTTAAITSKIAEHLAAEGPVLVLSGSSGFAPAAPANSQQPTVINIKNRRPAKAALIRRAMAEIFFAARIFLTLLLKLQRGDVAVTVTAPFMLPYAVAAAAKLKRARSVLIMHDLYPDVLVMAGLLKPPSIATKAISAANGLMFRALDVVVIIGRDTERLLLRHRGITRDKIRFIPNWATLAPAVRPIGPNNPYRRLDGPRFVVGLSGNLGFTHDPIIVFEAARLLRDDPDIHFLLSGWGIGFERLKDLQAEANLQNVTLVDRVEDEYLEEFLAAANVWLIPYRKNVAGVSVPSRFYNLLAVGRPVIIVSEPDAEAALTVVEHGLGWVVRPGRSDELARTIRLAASSKDISQAERASVIAGQFSFTRAMASYSELVQKLLRERL
ncbi:glycosyltransferase family 4 protein [Bradyrhizobium sp. URHD0069]|uniref:glycosyltransferase family 4 protein n=1 Tax=Bradyrhizobium sp. URHD0069 TaxID=1380355 RepID=UPI0004963FBE|nr:glycosyltransferase family 4 protein [Bradyrhizobium sp. URHD0069]